MDAVIQVLEGIKNNIPQNAVVECEDEVDREQLRLQNWKHLSSQILES
jgi:hypothetical protein